MADNNSNKEHLSRLLRQLPDRIPPARLVEQIMETVNESNKQYGRPEKPKFFSLPSWNTLWPRQFAAACSIVLAFWIGLYVGGKKEDAIVQSSTLELPAYVYQNAQAGFLVGRGILAAGKENDKALALIQHASQLSPDNPEYLFWLGTAHWRMGDTEMEQQSYRKAVQVDPDYVPALVNLGHNLLENKESIEALQTYNKVLSIVPDHEIALYNRALAISITGESNQTIDAWKQYLRSYRSGKWAHRAVQHLNGQNDFSYRVYQIGVRRIILNQELLLGPLTADKKREVEYLAETFKQAPVSNINLTFFYAGDKEKARKQATSLKSLLSNSLQNHNKRIRISWFAEAEVVQTASGIKSLQNGVLIFGKLQLSQVQGEAI